jgi:hypothetical protein
MQLGSRSIQLAADSSRLSSEVPKDGSEPFQVTVHEDSFRSYKCDVPSLEVTVTKDGLVDMYRQMQTMRRMEMAADKLYKDKLIRGFCHLAIGQEAVSVGLESAITPEDRVITAYRCHPFAVLRGGTVKGVIAELLGVPIPLPVSAGLTPLRSTSWNVARQRWLYAHLHSLLLWWKRYRWSSGPCGSRNCLCTEISRQENGYFCSVRRWCKQSGASL